MGYDGPYGTNTGDMGRMEGFLDMQPLLKEIIQACCWKMLMVHPPTYPVLGMVRWG